MKTAIVTGANSGLGFETSKELSKQGFEIIMACRDLSKGLAAKSEIRAQNQRAKLNVLKLDLSSLESVKEFAFQVHQNYSSLDLLINNAGIMLVPLRYTSDGYENHLATNYLGHFLLSSLLISLLEKGKDARIVSLSSLSYKWSEIRFDDINFKDGYDKKKAYGQSKRACLVFAYELAGRLESNSSQVRSFAAHPGLSNTNLDRHFNKFIRPLGALFLQKAENGALPILYAATSQNIKNGDFIGPDGFLEIRGKPKVVKSDNNSKDPTIGSRLWELSEQLVGQSFFPHN
jgi:NAD(P)-dependent dehydrogenase (short-subunit alcohol dehydrogenase family)